MEKTRPEITLSGNAGTGKSTLGKMLASHFKIPFFSVGDFVRQEAQKLGMNINEFQDYAEANPDFDRNLDFSLGEKMKLKAGYVLDYRLGFHFLPGSFKVLLKVSENEALKRILERNSFNEDLGGLEPAKQLETLRSRNEKMRTRFLKLYGVDFLNENLYDIVINTESSVPEGSVQLIVNAMRIKYA